MKGKKGGKRRKKWSLFQLFLSKNGLLLSTTKMNRLINVREYIDLLLPLIKKRRKMENEEKKRKEGKKKGKKMEENEENEGNF